MAKNNAKFNTKDLITGVLNDWSIDTIGRNLWKDYQFLKGKKKLKSLNELSSRFCNCESKPNKICSQSIIMTADHR